MLEDERQVLEERAHARMNLSVLKLGVHRFLVNRSGRYAEVKDVFYTSARADLMAVSSSSICSCECNSVD